MENLDFYHQIEKKKCEKCNCKIEEQAECYTNICDDCIPVIQTESAS